MNIPPIPFQQSIPAATRAVYFSEKFNGELVVEKIRIAFELNTQRTMKIRAWITFDQTTRTLTSPATALTVNSGLPLMGVRGTQDYVVGDGQEGTITIPIGRKFPRGCYLAVDAENSDSTAHALDVAFDVQEIA